MNPEQPLVSIIIPTYNRAHLIGETLDSVLAQTYPNWECIIVDDGSTDNTSEVVQGYLDKDPRFQYHHRPADRPKGANACRNYGFELSKGDYINWFDSDDIMIPEKINYKIKSFTKDLDFVISNSINFDQNGNLSMPYDLNYDIPITPENFITRRITWFTIDVLIKREVIKLRFDESLQSSQEHNFFSRLLFLTTNGKYVEHCLAKRRIHPDSIQEQLAVSEKKNIQLFINEWVLLRTLSKKLSKSLIQLSLKRLVRFSFNSTKPFSINIRQVRVLKALFWHREYINFFKYLLWIFFNLVSGKGYFIIKSINRSLN